MHNDEDRTKSTSDEAPAKSVRETSSAWSPPSSPDDAWIDIAEDIAEDEDDFEDDQITTEFSLSGERQSLARACTVIRPRPLRHRAAPTRRSITGSMQRSAGTSGAWRVPVGATSGEHTQAPPSRRGADAQPGAPRRTGSGWRILLVAATCAGCFALGLVAARHVVDEARWESFLTAPAEGQHPTTPIEPAGTRDASVTRQDEPPKTPPGPTFDDEAAQRAIEAAAQRAAACGKSGENGHVSVLVTFGSSGRPYFVRVDPRSPLSATATGHCIASALIVTEIPPFEGRGVTIATTVPLGTATSL